MGLCHNNTTINRKNCSLALNLVGAMAQMSAYSVGTHDRLQHNYLSHSVNFPLICWALY
jgi:hypothetical protein